METIPFEIMGLFFDYSDNITLINGRLINKAIKIIIDNYFYNFINHPRDYYCSGVKLALINNDYNRVNNMLSYCFIKYEYITTITYVRIIIQIFLVQLVSQDLSNSTLLFLFFECERLMFTKN